MKNHILSSTIALAYSAGLGLCVASDKPFSNAEYKDEPRSNSRSPSLIVASEKQPFLDSEFKGQPRVTSRSSALIVDPFPKRDMNELMKPSSQYSSLTLSELDSDRKKDSHIKQKQTFIESADQQVILHNRVIDLSQDHEKYEKSLNSRKKELSEQLEIKNNIKKQYLEYMNINNIYENSPQENKDSKAEHIKYLQGKLSNLKDPDEIKQYESSLALLRNNDSEQLNKNIAQTQEELKSLEEQISSLGYESLDEATKSFTQTLENKLKIPLEDFKLLYPSGTLISVPELKISLEKMGIRYSIAQDTESAKHLLGATLGNLLWPVFNPRDVESNITYSYVMAFKKIHSDIFETLKKNYTANVEATAGLINLMNDKKIPINLKLVPDDLSTYIKMNLKIQQPDNEKSMFLNAFLKKELFADFEGVTELLMANLKPTHESALLLLTGAAINSPTVLDQISARTFPAHVAATKINNKKLGANDGEEINRILLKSIQEITMNRFNILLLDYMGVPLQDVLSESK